MCYGGCPLITKLFITLITLEEIICSIDGIFRQHNLNNTKVGDDLCNPLYWYPKEIPMYCYYKKDMTEKPSVIEDRRPIPMPLPVPVPPIPVHIPAPLPQPILPPFIPQAMIPLPYPLPFGIPLAPTNPMIPIARIPMPPGPPPMLPPPPPPPMYAPPNLPQQMYPPRPMFPPPALVGPPSPFASYIPPFGIHRRPMTMVPGLPGLVAPDGGINILPFSDAYADLLEKHKQKMIRRRLQKLLDEYDIVNGKNSHQESNDNIETRNDINEY